MAKFCGIGYSLKDVTRFEAKKSLPTVMVCTMRFGS